MIRRPHYPTASARALAPTLALTLALAALPGAPATAADAPAPPSFARLFGDHAVLQRDRPIAVRGRAAPGAPVRVTLDGRVVEARADAAGAWRALLPAHAAGGPYTLAASVGGATTSLADVVVGDVYLCGGQSNMEFPARQATGAWGGLVAAPDPLLRFATVAKASEPAPLADLAQPAPWRVVAPDTIGDASAVCFFMARALQRAAGVPVGFVAADWGGTTIQGWIGADALRGVPGYAADVARVERLAADPAAAMADEERRQEAWWDRQDPGMAAQRAWIAPAFDDHAWPTLAAGPWKEVGGSALVGFDGVVWLRTSVTLTAAQAADADRLLLGPVDTYDTAWVNGRRVGGGGTAWLWRDYRVPAGLLHAGRNSVVLRVLGGAAGGGPTGPAGDRVVATRSGERVPLDPTWRYRTGLRAAGPMPTPPPTPWDVPTSLATLYNGMIAPIAGYGWKLAAWYQGESNVGAPTEYATLLPLLMRDWRRAAGQPDLPFVVAQLSGFGPPPVAPGASGWAALRDAQARAVRADPHAGLAVTFDVGDRHDIHPTQKRVVGERLAGAALRVAYGRAGGDAAPEAIDARRRDGAVVVRFRDAAGGLRSYGGRAVLGFEACDARGCRYVDAGVDGDRVVLRGVRPGDTRIRYAWADAPLVNLYAASDLPAAPFELAVR